MTPRFSEDDGMDRAFTPGQGGCLNEVRAYASRASEDIRVPNNVQRQSVKTTVQVLTSEVPHKAEPAHSGSDAKTPSAECQPGWIEQGSEVNTITVAVKGKWERKTGSCESIPRPAFTKVQLIIN